MANFFRFFALFIVALFATFAVDAQTADTMINKPVEMADGMRSNGKIFVVVAVLTIIFIGIIFYLVRLEKRIKQLENNPATS
jgi:CcmD family protein